MDNLLSVTFEAHNDERNHHRRYEIRLGRDLFGEWTVALSYGRTCRGGQEVRHSAADPERLRKMIRESLQRRLSAPKRIGCAYRLKEMSATDGVDVGFWLPEGALSAFA
jgi:WGR domain-containing protein